MCELPYAEINTSLSLFTQRELNHVELTLTHVRVFLKVWLKMRKNMLEEEQNSKIFFLKF